MLVFWQACLNQLKKELTPQQFKAWITPLAPVDYNDNNNDNAVLTISAPSRIKADACARQFGERLQALAQEYWGHPVQITFTVSAKRAVTKTTVATETAVPNKKEVNTHSSEIQDKKASTEKTDEANEKLFKDSNLEAELTFDSLVTGKANQLAKMIAYEVVEQPGRKYNPFFIYGGVGVGKTHLMHAIGNAVLEQNPSKKVRYLFANTYVSEIVKAYQNNKFDEFKQYYQSLDMLLIDDIQFFGDGKKEGTQFAFFELFESLIRDNKQIIITSDRYPKALEGIQERLRSRFESGISIEIEPPELEMRVGILLKKAAHEGIALSEDVAFFIAKLLRANVRELEGALRKVIAYSRFHKQDITVESTKSALKDLLNNNQDQISIESIQKAVADFYKISLVDMHSKKRPKNIAFPRQIAMFLVKELTQKSLPEIGAAFGGRDHTTVLHAVRKITEDRRVDSKLNHEIHLLEQILKG
ncbi:chromosomal replication initiator protein DnaA [Hydromonas duriensis]|uniref:Chromosomal replication initiator protein DnaA n=1 Tax=Hydromonas duriensis TaxID=1527608 RepID=A0A4R6YAI5_9BURK|nr:chromosomal replication initiator protein DnaA [Hydromonas duriensis]TDR32514.1 chromosomal replication initiator protein [Hydromonas duriensis]